MTAKELTVTDVQKKFNRSFRDYWKEHDGAVKAFKKRLISFSQYSN